MIKFICIIRIPDFCGAKINIISDKTNLYHKSLKFLLIVLLFRIRLDKFVVA